jgi:hypothetical protein
MAPTKKLLNERISELLAILKVRFEKNQKRHKGMEWENVEKKLLQNASALRSINEMENTGGEPDVVVLDKNQIDILYIDCSKETPKGRRSICYDAEALNSRKEHKPAHSAIGMAKEMGITLLTEEQYFQLQKIEAFDTKTSSWLQTPASIRKLGGAIFGDCRYERVFIYHNGAESYYGVRGFRGMVIL